MRISDWSSDVCSSDLEEFDGHYVRSVDGRDETTNHALSPVTPLPNPTYYMPPVGKPVPVDSWVELTFIDQDDNLLPPVRRTQLRTPKGKISETQSGFDTLGVDPIALRIGTIMPDRKSGVSGKSGSVRVDLG